MIWVCRAGKNSVYLDLYLCTNKIYLPWDGFKVDLKQFRDREQIKSLVRQEKGDVARTSISNWSGQLYSFCWEIKAGDYVLIPHCGSRSYSLARVIGEYEFSDSDSNGLWHSRNIKLLVSDIPREVFSQTMRYSLGAYRTLFRIRDEEEILASISKFQDKNNKR